MPSYNDQALILHRFPYGEADLILSLFTKNRGKVRVIAKGVRKITSRRSGHADLFNHVEIQVREGYGMGILTEVKAIQTFPQAKKSLNIIAQFYHLSEIVDHLLPDEDRNFTIYAGLVEYFLKLQDQPSDRIESIVRNSEVFILKTLGYWSDDVHGHAYPNNVDAQRMFNQQLIQSITERPLKSWQTFR